MARRKRLLDDDVSDSDNESEVDFDVETDPTAREERELFENPYQHKRRRKDGKEDAIYGIFGEDSEDEDRGPRGRGPAGKAKKSGWTKAPAFVSGDKKVDLDKEIKMDLDDDEPFDKDAVGGDDKYSESDESDDSGVSEDSESKLPSPRVREEEEEEPERPRMGGIGLGGSKSATAQAFAKGGIGSSGFKGGIGSFEEPSKGGIGARTTASTATSTPEPSDDMPSTFGKRSFVRNGTPSTKPAAPLSATELAHFSKLKDSFGARMLAKMGWQAGTGLGATGEGIVTPVETKLRPQKMGIAFKGFKEKTEQSKREARRRGEVVSDDEDEKTKHFRKKVKEQEQKRSDLWKRPKKVKTKVEHKTYEQILAEAGSEAPAVGLGQIIDATGAVPREVSSLADVSLNAWSPTNDPTRIPEIRHNIRLIADACKSDLDSLAREAKALEQRKKFAAQEDARLRKKVADEAELIERLQKIQIVANDINAKAKELASVYEVSLEPFSPLFYTLVDQFAREFERYRLDEIVVAAIAPLVRRMVAKWDPLEDPTAFVSTFRTWRRALRVNTEEAAVESQVDIYGAKTVQPAQPATEVLMTPFESLLWNVWLPKVRTSINNNWQPEVPLSAVRLYEAWCTFLPPFIRDNLLDQLILPKVQKAVADWSPRREVALRAIVFPWLPHVGLRMEDLLGDARRKVKSLLKSWAVGDKIPEELPAWKEVFERSDWDSMLLKYVVPKLGATLRDDFRVNPRNQQMEPLHHVLQWADTIRPSVFSQILETEFFPKWLDVLHIWLIQPRVSFEEVAQWYSFWKGTFPEAVQNLSGVSRGFTRGLQLMNKAIELGPDAPTQLARPDFRAELSAPSTPVLRNGSKGTPSVPSRPSALTHEITFRSIVEDFAATHNLLFIPTGRAHEVSRLPLFRVSPTAGGRGGLLVYIQDDAVWAPALEGEGYRAISLEDMVLRANNP
ncbi:putative GC-rich sequence DNA-binding factor-like protein [Lyophyllum shimeji]|uniref:GC-rich sequence DNA-binding factor-like protein n=1 Tax=Lyophyllum shimeji TaxID=47721 RepID=A0A9P3PS96_LYOSH|nr:putative GC-rich sequence DNA-binding factor-like protein [Lyophyllum shimeji]